MKIKWDEKGEWTYMDADMYKKGERRKRISRDEAMRLKSLMSDVRDEKSTIKEYINNKKVILEFYGRHGI